MEEPKDAVAALPDAPVGAAQPTLSAEGENPSTNPFEVSEPSSGNPFGSDHEMDGQPNSDTKVESSEMDTNTEPNSADVSEVSTEGPKEAVPQLTPEEQARLDQARKISQNEVMNGGNRSSAAKKRKTPEELAKLSTRNYLDETVVPVLLVGMSELARRRPERPLEWLAKFLMNKQEKDESEENGPEKGGDADEVRRANGKGKTFQGAPPPTRQDSVTEQPAAEITSA